MLFYSYYPNRPTIWLISGGFVSNKTVEDFQNYAEGN